MIRLARTLVFFGLAALYASAWAGPRPDSPSGVLLQRLVDAWPALTETDQQRAAHALAVLDFRSAVPALRECAAADSPSGASCVLALVALRDLKSAELLRQHLRQSTNPLVLATCGQALGAWRDRHSHALLMETLLSGRGGDLAGADIAAGVDTLEHAWEQVYLRLALRVTDSELIKLALAARLVNHSPYEERPSLADRLTHAFQQGFGGPPPSDAAALYRTSLAVWGMSRGLELECEATVRMLEASAWAGPELWRAASPDCVRAVSQRRQVRPIAPLAPVFPVPPGGDLPEASAGWAAELSERLGGRLGWPEDGAERFSRLLTAALGARPAAPWGPSAAPSLARGLKISRLHSAVLAKMGAGATFPPEFDALPTLSQPAWWPEGLHLTIDDGPRPEALEVVLDALDKHRAKATFFFVGRQIARRWVDDPFRTRMLLQRVVDSGHEIGFHGMDHLTEPFEHMTSWRTAQVVDSVRLFRRILTLAAGREIPVRFGRYPGGTRSSFPRARLAFHRAGLHAPLIWDAGPPEWKQYTPINELRALAPVLAARAPQRTIVLLHEYAELATELDAFLSQLH